MTENVQDLLGTLVTADKPDEHEIKSMLSRFGIPVPKGRRLQGAAPVDTGGLNAPYVAKVCSGEILHKTDVGGVLTGLTDASLASAVSNLRSRFPGRSILVEEQVTYEGTEFIVGGIRDPDFGLAVMAGGGGVLTELYRDVTFRLAPLSPAEARRMLEELHIAPVLSGYRNMRLNGEALAALISAVGDLIYAIEDRFDQLDLNPVVFTQGQWTALDAKLVLREPPARNNPHSADAD
jgi:succinyl-CoA synthetase beta subunit